MWIFNKNKIAIKCDMDNCYNRYESKEEYTDVEKKANRLGWKYNFKADFCPECCGR